MSKPRPGVAAAKRLAKCSDNNTWESVEALLPEVVNHVDGLKKIEKDVRERLLPKDSRKTFITKEDLLAVVNWKFSVGKPRHALMKHLKSNTETSVRENSSAAFAKARNAGTKTALAMTKNALEDLINLKGVGPATASAVLALVRPDLFAYMYDEAIECFLPKRTYTMSTYLTLNTHCTEIASKLGHGWTTSRVARALWTAARANAYGLHDHTLSNKRTSNDHGTIHKEGNNKRRRIQS